MSLPCNAGTILGPLVMERPPRGDGAMYQTIASPFGVTTPWARMLNCTSGEHIKEATITSGGK